MKQRVPLSTDNKCSAFPIPDGAEVVFFGAGQYIQAAIHALMQRGIRPSCIIDNSLAQHGKTVMCIPVLAPADARSLFPDATVVISAAPGHIDDIRAQSAAMGWIEIHDCAFLLSSFDYTQDTFSLGVSAMHFVLDRYFYEYFLKFHPDKLIIPSLDIVITEKCSLKCRDCANLMQYYTDPLDVDLEKLFAALDVFMQSIDHVLEFRVIGGETFMNRNAYKYVDKLRQYKNYTRIAVYSNGTIIPRGENLQCLTHEDTYLRISDYGALSKNLQGMAELFDTHGVTYDAQKCEYWQDCAGIGRRHRTPAELESVFSSCCANKTLTLMNKSIYVCPFAAHAANLGAVPCFPRETVEIDDCISRQEIRNRLFSMLRTEKYFSSCEYCAGRPYESTPLPAAIQTPAPLFYDKLS